MKPLPMKPLIVKIGGSSLFSNASIRELIATLQESFPEQAILLIVGGGELVESMRLIHELRPELNIQKMHWRCIQLLESTLDIAVELTPDIPVFRQWESLQAAVHASEQLPAKSCPLQSLPPIAWVSIRSYYDETTNLPHALEPQQNWNTTSDTLAWLLAVRLNLEHIVLLKNGLNDQPKSLQEATARGIIDAELARLAARTPSIRVEVKFVEPN